MRPRVLTPTEETGCHWVSVRRFRGDRTYVTSGIQFSRSYPSRLRTLDYHHEYTWTKVPS